VHVDRALERSERAKRTMISDVSHELRTPLTNVIGLLEAMRDGLRAPDAATIESAREEAALLATLVDELQELSTAEAGALRYDLEPLDAVAEAHAAAAASRPAGGPRVEPPPAPAQPVWVLADRRRLAQVLRNLLRNAITHTPATGVVRVEVAPLGAGRVALAVVDDGEGISPDQLPLVWERFHRVDPSRSRETGGMGLGLAVVRQLVRGMGGEVSAESAPGVGSRFTVVLPSA
jgi:two-component system, OmpR family, sensor histidine kinase BaeS